MKSIFKYIYVFAGLIIFSVACKEDSVTPMLPDSSEYVSPELMNSPTRDPETFLQENAVKSYEIFEWEKADYGAKLPTNYHVMIDTSEAFTNPALLGISPSTELDVSVEQFNNAMLKLGLTAFEESTVQVRAFSVVEKGGIDTLASAAISRTATTYKSSDCGDFCNIGLIGSATPGGWDVDTDMRIADPERTDLNTWTVTVFLKAGECKFRADDDWAVNWGGSDYPSGTASQDGANIPIPADGYYRVTFNDQNGAYEVSALTPKDFTTIGVIGDATPGGWDSDTDLTQDATDTHLWTGEITLTDGEAKFRAENDWGDNWGSTTFPSGYGTSGGPNIPSVAGTYYVTFHDVTGEYAFMRTVDNEPYAAIGVIGDATPGGWDADTDMIQNPSNPFRWSVNMSLSEAEAKFRADDAWDNNWGGAEFPKGVGIKGGSNIPTKDGSYTVHFHTGTGEYWFLN